MRTHGLAPLKPSYAPAKLRKTAPAAKLAKPIVNPLKWLTWHETLRGEWQAGVGNPVLAEADLRAVLVRRSRSPFGVGGSPAPRAVGAARPARQARLSLQPR